jgi:integrase/recombinase XerD
MREICLHKKEHRGAEVVFLQMGRDAELHDIVRGMPGRRWSKTNKCWYFVYGATLRDDLLRAFRGKACLEFSGLGRSGEVHSVKAPDVHSGGLLGDLDDLQKDKVEQFKRWMLSKRYSASTIGTYTEALVIFLRYCYEKPLSEIRNEDLITFNNDYILKNKLSSSYQNQIVNAIKLFFGNMEHRKMDPDLIHRPKRQHVLPNVLSKEEVKALLEQCRNLKHRTMLSIIYSAGLRCGELINLRLRDVEMDRQLIMIRSGKGNRDRVVPLSPKIKALVETYIKEYRPREYVFEGWKNNPQYDVRSLQQVLKQAVQRAGIKKPVSLHWLRHSYATHLLDTGTHLRYIQQLLGHKSSRTTDIYTHVSSRRLEHVRSPFDDL